VVADTTGSSSSTPAAVPLDPACAILPGCTKCGPRPAAAAAGHRHLMQAGGNRRKFSVQPNVYAQPNLAYCVECNTPGYRMGSNGKCGECTSQQGPVGLGSCLYQPNMCHPSP
jgi:hypothetical protein